MRILYLSDDVDFLKILDKIKIEIIYDENIDYDISIIDIDQWNDNEYSQIDWRKYKKPIETVDEKNRQLEKQIFEMENEIKKNGFLKFVQKLSKIKFFLDLTIEK